MAHLSTAPPGQGLDAFLRLSLAVPGPCYEELYLLAGGRGEQRQAFLETLIREEYAVRDPCGDFRLTAKGQRRALRGRRRGIR
jgi:hypothetical protein